MDVRKHCQLCKHQKVDFVKGTLCGLTDKKPDFHGRCIKAEFNHKLESKIESVNIELLRVKRMKWLVYTNFIVFLGVTILVVLAGFFLAKYLLKFNAISAVPFIISLVGVLFVLPIAIGPLNTYLNDLKLATARKIELDAILDAYKIRYNIDVKFGKSYHGTQDVYVDLDVKR